MTRRLRLSVRNVKLMVSAGRFLLTAAVLGFVAGDASGQTGSQASAPRRLSQEQVAHAETAGETAAKRSPGYRVDTQVVPAGAHMLHKRQRVCPQGGCGPGGTCQGTCVVRPGRFGYYATQWRPWPGDGGVQQASLQEMTPVSPPASAIPSVDEEALMPSSLMPEDDDTSFGSDNFGFEEVVPAPQAPPLPAPGGPENPPAAPDAGMLDPAEGSTPPQAAPERPSLFDEDPAPEKPSVLETPAKPAQPESPAADPATEKKSEESLDNLFDDFGRASQLHNDRLRQRLAVANQQVARQQAQQRSDSGSNRGWKPRELTESAESRPLRSGTPQRGSRVVPTSAEQQTGVRSNPLR